MLNRILAGALALALIACAPVEAASFKAKFHGGHTAPGGGGGGGDDGGGSGNSPTVLPGATQPDPDPDLNTYGTVTPASYGSSSDWGYARPGFARWNAIQWVELGKVGVSETRKIGLLAAHQPTNAELAAGTANNICSVKVRIDGGSWYTITGTSTDADGGGLTDWNFTVNSQDFADGLHKVDAEVIPCTGPSIIMEGPRVSTEGHFMARVAAASISGTTLTRTGWSGNWNFSGAVTPFKGWSVSGLNVAPNTQIVSCASSTVCTVNISQTVASTSMTLGEETSYYFITNYGGTLNRGNYVAYVSTSGSDSNTGASAASPLATIGKANQVIAQQDSGSVLQGRWGGVICLMGGNTHTYGGQTTTQPYSLIGWTVIQSADKYPCNAPGDPGGASLAMNSATSEDLRAYFANRQMFRYIAFTKTASVDASGGGPYPDMGNPGGTTYLAVDHVTSKSATLETGGLLGNGAYACVESVVWWGHDGGCNNSTLIRGNEMKYYVADGIHGGDTIVGNILDGGGPIHYWATASTTAGSPVITGVTLPGGAALSSVIKVGKDLNVYDGEKLMCFPYDEPGTFVAAVDDAAHTITLDRNAAVTCTNHWLATPGAHGDMIQHQTNFPTNNIFVWRNKWGETYAGYQAGFFLEVGEHSGVYVGENYFKRAPDDDESLILTYGANQDVIFDRNDWPNVYTDLNLRFDVYDSRGSNFTTLYGDTCNGGIPPTGFSPGSRESIPNGFFGYGQSINTRRKAPASNACYTTSP